MTDTPLTRLGPVDGGNFEFSWSNQYFEVHLISDVGEKREHNEDSCVLCAPENEWLAKERGLVCAVADGMGGASAGERASRLALTSLAQEYYSHPIVGVPELLLGAVRKANADIFEDAEANPAYQGMGTTVSAMVLLGDLSYIAHVGDSRVYVAREKLDLFQVTEDHSLVAEQVKSGIISEEEAKHHSLKNLITRAVGIKSEVEVDLFVLRLKKGDTLLICSDGLSGLVEDSDIGDSLRTPNLQAAARLLVGKAIENGGNDNISVAVVRVTETPPRLEIQEGCTEINIPSAGFFGKLIRMMT